MNHIDYLATKHLVIHTTLQSLDDKVVKGLISMKISLEKCNFFSSGHIVKTFTVVNTPVTLPDIAPTPDQMQLLYFLLHLLL